MSLIVSAVFTGIVDFSTMIFGPVATSAIVRATDSITNRRFPAARPAPTAWVLVGVFTATKHDVRRRNRTRLRQVEKCRFLPRVCSTTSGEAGLVDAGSVPEFQAAMRVAFMSTTFTSMSGAFRAIIAMVGPTNVTSSNAADFHGGSPTLRAGTGKSKDDFLRIPEFAGPESKIGANCFAPMVQK